MAVDDAVGWTLRVAKTLAALHRRGLAHGNLCAQAIDIEGPDCHAAGTLLSATRVAAAPSYQSAERAAGQPPTPADDVWAAGALLYQALSGEPPFGGEAPREGGAPQLTGRPEAAALQSVLDRIFHAERTERIVTAHALVMVLGKHHADAEALGELELPADSVRAAHRVRHASRPILDAVSAEEASLSAPGSDEPPESDPEAEWAEDRPTLPHAPVPVPGPAAPAPAGAANDALEEPGEDEDDVPQRDSESEFLGWLGDAGPPVAAPAEDAAPPEAAVRAPAPSPLPPAVGGGADGAMEARDGEPTGDDDTTPKASEAAPEAAQQPEATPTASEPARRAEPAGAPPRAGSGSTPPSSRAAPSARPAAASAEPPARRRRVGWPLQVAIALMVIALAYLLMHRRKPERPPPSAPSATAHSQTGRAPATAPPAGSTASAAPEGSTTTAAAVAAGHHDPAACFAALEPEDTFAASKPNAVAVCRRVRPGKGARAIRQLVVEAGRGRGVTDAMVEWSRLGWYEMAAFAFIHGRCCEGELELSHARFRVCDLGERLRALHAAARGGQDIDAAVAGVDEAVKCAWRSNNGKLFNQSTQPTGQQLDYLRAIVARAKL